MQSRILLVNVRVLAICDTEELTFKTSRNTARVSSVNGPDRVCNIKTMDRDKRIGPINETHNMCNWEFERENERLEVRFRGSNETTGCEGFFLCYKGKFVVELYHLFPYGHMTFIQRRIIANATP